jgi:hypothetical protein
MSCTFDRDLIASSRLTPFLFNRLGHTPPLDHRKFYGGFDEFPLRNQTSFSTDD